MERRVETLVVGAGPVGLFLAAELHRRGRSCMLIEREKAASTHSKALAIMPGTMQLFERSGIAHAFLSAANRIDGVRFVTPHRSVFVPFAGIQSAYNYVSILPQWKTQALLEARLRELGGNVAYGHTLLSLEPQPGSVRALVESGGHTYAVSARYVAGCDGIASTVRDAAGMEFRGGPYPGSALLADAVLKTSIPVNEARVHVNALGVVTMFPMNERMRRIVVIAPREALPERAPTDWLQQRLAAAGYDEALVEDVRWSNTFRVQRRIASAMQRGNVLLAGDSVHTHSPVGGQGMNIGLHDAWTLAEKLSRVLSGEAPQSLLESYERERLPVARGVLRRTDVLTRVLAHPNPLLRVTRERIAPVVAGLPAIYGPMIRRLSLTA
jgi:2-polyprenyl-6-methoxyphenol hydroxylase-like FAD-dependent oxidoreductase